MFLSGPRIYHKNPHCLILQNIYSGRFDLSRPEISAAIQERLFGELIDKNVGALQ